MKTNQSPLTSATRMERDTMGELAVPVEAYYGVQTARAIENFPISDFRFPRRFLRALGMLKKASALANMNLALLEKKLGEAIGISKERSGLVC